MFDRPYEVPKEEGIPEEYVGITIPMSFPSEADGAAGLVKWAGSEERLWAIAHGGGLPVWLQKVVKYDLKSIGREAKKNKTALPSREDVAKRIAEIAATPHLQDVPKIRETSGPSKQKQAVQDARAAGEAEAKANLAAQFDAQMENLTPAKRAQLEELRAALGI